tara:strand:- start:393 stop:1004 length:612 start_codon:yes stop_codon:yes gene_type:complete
MVVNTINPGVLVTEADNVEFYEAMNELATEDDADYDATVTTASSGPLNVTNTGGRKTVTQGGNNVIAHPKKFIISHHLELDQLIPINIHHKMVITGITHNEIISELKKDNLANKVLDVYYRIKRNVEYIAQGKESLYSINPQYPTILGGKNFNSRHSRHYFYLIAHEQNLSFGLVVNLAGLLLQNNKLRLEQNTKGLYGYKLL